MVGPLRTRPARLPETGRRHRRGWWTLPLVVALALLASGCQGGPGDDDTPRAPLTLVVSDTWVRSHSGSGTGGASGAGEAQARIRSLQEAVDRLRRETRSGWVGRQDDVTGYLSELSGGTWRGASPAFMDEYGPALFGVDSSTLRFGDVDTTTIPGATTTRATQALGEVPVLDGSLVFSGRGSGAATDSLRVTAVRGRVYPDLTVGTTPTLTPEQASAAAAAAASGTADGEPRLVVLPRGAGVLAWEVVVVGDGTELSTGLYYVDATTGALVDSRPGSGDVAAPTPAIASFGGPVAAPDPGSVEVSGTDPLGRERTAYGVQSGDRVELTDTTTPAWDAASGTGAVQTFDATGLTSPGSLPGELVRSRSTTIRDPEAIAAQSFSNTIVSYFEALGRDSWDDQGGSLFSSVHFGGEGYCNASFISGLRQPQMVYGDACVLGGEQQTGSFVEPDIAAHEITHGVTATSAGLLYTGQSGALNESFSDYFGNIIGDRIHGSDSSALGEDSCSVVPTETRFCVDNPDGTRSFRTMLNGNDFDDYLRILDPGRRLQLLLNYKQDYGGVHYNSAIWNNALWTIRSRLAQIDGEDMRTSPLAASFDQAVYGALATRLTPNSGFVDARAAVEQVVVDSSLDPVVLRVAREVFDQNKICTGCPDTGDLAGDPVNTSPQTQLHPTVSGDQVVWLDLSAGTEFAGYAGAASVDAGGAPRLTGAGEAVEVTFAGDAVVALDYNGRIVRYEDGDGAPAPVDDVDVVATLAAGLVGGADGAAWLAADGDAVTFLSPEGEVTPLAVPGLQGDTVTSIGVGGGSVAVGTDQGKVFVGAVDSGTLTQVGQVDGAVISSATYDGTVFVIADDATSTLITADGQSAPVTDRAAPFGATMSGDHVVWAEAVGPMESGVGPGGQSPYPDTDLYLLSLSTGQIYDLHPAPAQQGFPSLDGDRLVWQDSTFGGDDVFTATVPEGL